MARKNRNHRRHEYVISFPVPYDVIVCMNDATPVITIKILVTYLNLQAITALDTSFSLPFFLFFFSSRKFRLVEISTSIDELHASTFLNFHLDSKWKSRTVHSRSKRLFAFKCIKTPDKYRARLDGKSGARRITRAKKRRNLCTVVCASLWIRLVEILKSDLSAKMDRTEFPPPSRLFGISEMREFKDVVSMTRTFEVF